MEIFEILPKLDHLIIGRQLFDKQQKGELTDCTFRFKIQNDDGKVEEKVIHGHKLVLSGASKYFETNFKPQWSNNEPILIETVEFSIFEKLMKAIYLRKLEFESLKESADLYEAAHFYQLESILDLLRYEIPEFCVKNKSVGISDVANISWKYQDYILMHFTTKFFCANTSRIIKNAYFMNFTPEVVNWLFQYDELSVEEGYLVIALEKLVEEGKMTIDMIKPAIRSLRFFSLCKDDIEETSLLTEAEKDFFLQKPPEVNFKTRKPRKLLSFFNQLPGEIQVELSEKFSVSRCWVCQAYHNVFKCKEAKARYSVYGKIMNYFQDHSTTVYAISGIIHNASNLKSHQLSSVLKELEKYDENFPVFSNIDSVLKEMYYLHS